MKVFIAALIAFVVVCGVETKHAGHGDCQDLPGEGPACVTWRAQGACDVYGVMVKCRATCGGCVPLPQDNEILDEQYLAECRKDVLEIGIVLDTSASIGNDSFKKGKEFLNNFVSKYEIGPTNVRVSLISYGKQIYKEEGFNLTDYTSKASLLSAIDKLTYRYSSSTRTAQGIRYMARVQMTSARPGVRRVAIVLTDGLSAKPAETSAEAEAARKSGIVMVAVGVGHNVEEEELERISGSKSMSIHVGSYDALYDILDKLTVKVCDKQPPQELVCGSDKQADIFFVFSPMDLGESYSIWMSIVVQKLMKFKAMKTGFQIGLSTGNCSTDHGFDLVPDLSDDVVDHLTYFVKPRLPPLVDNVLHKGFAKGRPGVKKVVVLAAPSGDDNKRDVMEAQVIKLLEQGIQVIILDPGRQDWQVSGATTVVEKHSDPAARSLVTLLCAGDSQTR